MCVHILLVNADCSFLENIELMLLWLIFRLQVILETLKEKRGNLKKLFIYFWLCWVFIATEALLELQAWASHCGGFSYLLQSTGRRLQGFSSCGLWA